MTTMTSPLIQHQVFIASLFSLRRYNGRHLPRENARFHNCAARRSSEVAHSTVIRPTLFTSQTGWKPLPRWGVIRAAAPPHGECQPPAGEVITMTRLTRPTLCAKFELASPLKAHKDRELPASSADCHSGSGRVIALEHSFSSVRPVGRGPRHGGRSATTYQTPQALDTDDVDDQHQ